MEITLNTYSKDAYELAEKYLNRHSAGGWTNAPRVSAFSIAVPRHEYDDTVYIIDPVIRHFYHLIIAEEYVERYRHTYDTVMSRSSYRHSLLREAGIRKPQTSNSLRPFEPSTKKKTNSSNGGRTKRRTHHTRSRGRRNRRTRHFSKKS
jgi:hypothetical protein